jgi:adenylate cyclase
MEKHGIEKLKTIGDSYMCAGGIPSVNGTHPVDIVLAAMDINFFMDKCAQTLESTGNKPWDLRIGIHTGPLVAGVIGNTKIVYDTWGDTVNIASRMEGAGEPGKINVSLETKLLLEKFFEFAPRGKIEVKSKGLMDMFYVTGIKADLSLNGGGKTPNESFRRLYARIEGEP